MIPIGMLLAWGGYAAAMWGYCMIRGYNVSFTDLASPVHYYTGPKATRPGTWPPKCCPPDVIIPSKATIGKGVDCAGTSAAPGASPGQITSPQNGKCPPGHVLSNGKCLPVVAPGPPLAG